MIIVERMIQHIRPDKWADLDGLDKKYNVVETRLGFPAKKRYQCLSGINDMNTLIIERQWESLAKMEATFEKAMSDPEYQKLQQESTPIVKSNQWELYMPLP